MGCPRLGCSRSHIVVVQERQGDVSSQADVCMATHAHAHAHAHARTKCISGPCVVGWQYLLPSAPTARPRTHVLCVDLVGRAPRASCSGRGGIERHLQRVAADLWRQQRANGAAPCARLGGVLVEPRALEGEVRATRVQQLRDEAFGLQLQVPEAARRVGLLWRASGSSREMHTNTLKNL